MVHSKGIWPRLLGDCTHGVFAVIFYFSVRLPSFLSGAHTHHNFFVHFVSSPWIQCSHRFNELVSMFFFDFVVSMSLKATKTRPLATNNVHLHQRRQLNPDRDCRCNSTFFTKMFAHEFFSLRSNRMCVCVLYMDVICNNMPSITDLRQREREAKPLKSNSI